MLFHAHAHTLRRFGMLLSTWCSHCTCGERRRLTCSWKKYICSAHAPGLSSYMCAYITHTIPADKDSPLSINPTLLIICMTAAQHMLRMESFLFNQSKHTHTHTESGGQTAWSVCSQCTACSPSGQGILLTSGLTLSPSEWSMCPLGRDDPRSHSPSSTLSFQIMNKWRHHFSTSRVFIANQRSSVCVSHSRSSFEYYNQSSLFICR